MNINVFRVVFLIYNYIYYYTILYLFAFVIHSNLFCRIVHRIKLLAPRVAILLNVSLPRNVSY